MPYTRTLTIAVLSCLIPLVAQAQAPTPPPEPSMAENYLTDSIVKVRLMPRIAAKLDQDVSMLTQTFKLVGNYYKDTDHRIRLQLKLEGLGDTSSDMLQICDGKILWDYQKVLGMQIYRKREITPILKKLEDPALERDFKNMVLSQLGFGGPEAMLMGLKNTIKFDQHSEEKLDVDGVSVLVVKIGGTWVDRSRLMGPNDRPLAPTSPLPPYIPSNVVVYLGKANGWPYKIEMIGNAPSMLQEDSRAIDPTSGRPVGQPRKPPKVDPSKIVLTYRLLPESDITPKLFVFDAPADTSPGSVLDETKDFLAQLDQIIQGELNRKKVEAAKAEGEPLLKVSPIDVKADPNAGPPIPTVDPASPK